MLSACSLISVVPVKAVLAVIGDVSRTGNGSNSPFSLRGKTNPVVKTLFPTICLHYIRCTFCCLGIQLNYAVCIKKVRKFTARDTVDVDIGLEHSKAAY
jgi:hypothetical protein